MEITARTPHEDEICLELFDRLSNQNLIALEAKLIQPNRANNNRIEIPEARVLTALTVEAQQGNDAYNSTVTYTAEWSRHLHNPRFGIPSYEIDIAYTGTQVARYSKIAVAVGNDATTTTFQKQMELFKDGYGLWLPITNEETSEFITLTAYAQKIHFAVHSRLS